MGGDWFAVGTQRRDWLNPEPGSSEVRSDAGAVYLYNGDGDFIRRIENPDPDSGDRFGSTLARFGDNRFLVGAPSAEGNIGQVYIYNLKGDLLCTLDNPNPSWSDHFGEAISAIDDEYFVVGVPTSDRNELNAGSVHVYHSPLSGYELASEIPPPPGVSSLEQPPTGPEVEPPGAAFCGTR